MKLKQQNLIYKLAQMIDFVDVKEDGSRSILNEESNDLLKTNVDPVFYFLERFDSAMLKLMLDDIYTYQDYEKKVFVKKLSYAFDELLSRGNTHLNRFKETVLQICVRI